MLGNLDNEIIFKKAFTDKLVFTTFVKDILGIDVIVDKIETEKQFNPKVGFVDFKLDIFAETVDKRIAIEIQRIEYDHNFDRFLHYFLANIIEQQKSSREYGIEQIVYMIVVLTNPYTISEKSGKPVIDEVLVLKINPSTLKGEERDLYGHQFVCLNPNHPDEDTPQSTRDWLDFIYQSIHNPLRPNINLNNEGIKRAAELIDFDNLTGEERANSKNKEAARVAKLKYEEAATRKGRAEGMAEGKAEGKAERDLEVAINGIKAGLSEDTIAQITGLAVAQIQELKEKIA